MNLILPLFHLEPTLGADWSRPLGLMPVANATLLDQLLTSVRKWVGAFTPIFITTPAGQPMLDWWAATYPDQPARSVIVSTADLLPAIRQCRDIWRGGPVLLTTGEAIIDVDLSGLADEGTDVVEIVRMTQPGGNYNDDTHRAAGLWWLRDGGLLDQAALTDWLAEPESVTGWLTGWLLELGATVTRRDADMVEMIDVGLSPVERLHTLNRRLLGFGRSSEDAIERSYGEDFVVITPVYIDETAVIDGAVIGPFTTVAAGATVRGSVIGNSIIGPEAAVENVVLNGAIVGAGSSVRGQTRAILAADNSALTLEAM